MPDTMRASVLFARRKRNSRDGAQGSQADRRPITRRSAALKRSCWAAAKSASRQPCDSYRKTHRQDSASFTSSPRQHCAQNQSPALSRGSGFFVNDDSTVYALAEVSAPRSAAIFSVEKASIRSPSFRSLNPPSPMPHSMPLVTSRASSLNRFSEPIFPL